MAIFLNIRVNFFFILIICTLISPLKASEPFQDVVCEKKAQFTRKNSTIFIECYDASSFAEKKISFRSFQIKMHGDNTQIIGRIGTKYIFETRQIYIANVEIYESYRGNGYCEEALRTVLGLYRSPKNSHLNFDHFFLTVGTGDDRAAARHIYEKLNFYTVESFSFGYQNMRCER